MEHAEGRLHRGAARGRDGGPGGLRGLPEWAEVRTARHPGAGRGRTRRRWRSRSTCPSSGKAAHCCRRAPGDTGLSWIAKEAEGRSETSGEYLLDEVSDSETKVTYRLAVEIGVLVPGFVRTEGAKGDRERARAAEASRRDGLGRPPHLP